MNVQAHMSGQVPNPNGNPLPPPQMQNLAAASTGGGGPPPNQYSADPELHLHAGKNKSVQPVNEAQKQKVKELTIRLEDGLFKAAQTKDDYMNLNTLESRLSNLIRRPTVNSHNQRHVQLVNSSPPAGSMIPTPGMPHNGNSNMMVSSVDTMMVTSSGCDNIAPISVNSGNLLTGGMHGGSFTRADGTLSNGYQQSPASFSISSGGNMPSMGVHRMPSQMIPTPGFNSSNNNNNNNNQAYMNMESSNNSGGYSSVESTMVPQPQQQKQYVVGQNSHILPGLGTQIGSNIRSGMPQKSYGFSNGTLNGGTGMIGNNLQLVNEPGISEGFIPNASYTSSPKPLQQQPQRQLMHGDGYGMGTSDSLGSGNIYGVVASSASIGNPQIMSSVSLQSISKTNIPLANNQSNLHGTHHSGHMKSQLVDQFEKMNFHSPASHQQQNFQQQRQFD